MVLFGYCSSLLATFLLKIPNGIQGYVHMGDGFIMLFSSVLSPLCAVLVAAAGSALADIAGGYAYFALFTLIIKGLEAFLIAKIFQKSKLRFVSYFTGSIVMIFGYFLTDAFINQELVLSTYWYSRKHHTGSSWHSHSFPDLSSFYL